MFVRKFVVILAMLLCVVMIMASATELFGQNPAGEIIPWAPIQFYNASGVLAAGGKLCSFEAGTSTPLDTYTTNDLMTANDNPLVLNSAGRPSTNGIFLAKQSYKFILYSPLATGSTCPLTGTTVWTVDGIANLAQLQTLEFATKDLDNTLLCSQYDGATAGAKIQACLDALPSSGGTADARGLEGAQSITSTVTIASKKLLRLGASTYTCSASPCFTVTVGAAGTSGSLQGIGPQSVISYTGSGHAINIIGSGDSSSMVEVSDLSISGTSSGLSGLHLKSFNKGLFSNLQISGFTTASGILNEGANNVTFRDVTSRGNLYGIRNVGVTGPYAANAVLYDGGRIVNNTGYGIFEDGSGSGGGVGPNYNNVYRTTLEHNGVNGSSSTGHAFFQYCYGCKLVDSYLEYGGGINPNISVLIGDGTYAPINTTIERNTFLSGAAVTTIANTNGVLTSVYNNLEAGAVTNFVMNGSGSRALTTLRNRAAAATNFICVYAGCGGFDDGADSLIVETTQFAGINPNAIGTTTTGLGLNVVRGLNQDFVIRARSGGTYIVTFDAIDGTDRINILENGQLLQAGIAFASLGTPSAGVYSYCSDCQVTSGADNTCTSGGNGAMAFRLNGVWRCFAAQN